MRYTLKQLAQFCAVYNLDAEIDGDHMCAHLFDRYGLVNTIWLK